MRINFTSPATLILLVTSLLAGCNDNISSSASMAAVDEVTLLGYNWAYESSFSHCPGKQALYANTEFRSADGLHIDSYDRFGEGRLIVLTSCDEVASSSPSILLSRVHATDPINHENYNAMIVVGLMDYYGIEESAIEILSRTITKDVIQYEARLSAYGYSTIESTTLTRGQALN